ncbi:MAG: protein kinase [Chloracidobacterium sp.]|nr:protein kinase [Chloracidobacterium sp.]
MPSQDDILEFTKTQPFTFERFLDKGATGRTALIRDELLDLPFVCKKYEVDDVLRRREYYDRFCDEVKLLYTAFHPNVVRIFSSYLFPTARRGYILMEYIDGTDLIDYLRGNPSRASSLFVQALAGFAHLEEKNILHRDIRPSNVMITNDGILKIIDFGFGKHIDSTTGFGKSITLNWAASEPAEFENGEYDFCTECYFVGKLFDKAVKETKADFEYSGLLRKMTEHEPADRVKSFAEARKLLRTELSVNTVLGEDARLLYKPVAEYFTGVLSKLTYPVKYVENPDKVLASLKSVLQDSLFETVLLNHVAMIRVFIHSPAYFWTDRVQLSTSALEQFANMFENQSDEMKKIILSNLWTRFDKVPRQDPDDIPF